MFGLGGYILGYDVINSEYKIVYKIEREEPWYARLLMRNRAHWSLWDKASGLRLASFGNYAFKKELQNRPINCMHSVVVESQELSAHEMILLLGASMVVMDLYTLDLWTCTNRLRRIIPAVLLLLILLIIAIVSALT